MVRSRALPARGISLYEADVTTRTRTLTLSLTLTLILTLVP